MGRKAESIPEGRSLLSPPRIVVRLKAGASPPTEFQGLKWESVYAPLTDEEEKSLEERAVSSDPDYDPVDFSRFVTADIPNEVPPGDRLFNLIDALRQSPSVESAY